jgi:hypothetical protein
MEILLLLNKHPSETWTPERVFQTIQSNTASIARWLEELCREGFLQAEASGAPSYRYAPAQPLAEEVRALSAAYEERPVRVLEAIFSKSNRPLHHFAEAFRLRKDS